MSLSREPARPHDPGYPTFSEFDPARRAALRAIGLAGLSAVGLQLVGCTGGGGTGTPTTGPATDTGTPPNTDTDWVPWRDTETPQPPEDMPLGGAPPPSNWNQPIAIVVGGGPIAVTFSDGVTSSLAVALVVQPNTTPEAVKADAPEHAAAVRAAAKALPSSTLDSADGIAALEARIQEEVRMAVPGLVIEGVQAAPAVPDAPPEEEPSKGSSAPPPSSPAPAPAPSASAPAPAPPPPSPMGGVAAKPARAPVTGRGVWVPCGKPGCTSCGKR